MVELPPPGAEGGEPDDKDKPLPSWNAVCVMGLRVYAKDPDVTITLDTPKDAQQAASVTVDEKTPAGATYVVPRTLYGVLSTPCSVSHLKSVQQTRRPAVDPRVFCALRGRHTTKRPAALYSVKGNR